MFGKSKEKTLKEKILEFLTDADGKYIYTFAVDGVDLNTNPTRIELLPQDMFVIQLEDDTEYIAHLSRLVMRRRLKNK